MTRPPLARIAPLAARETDPCGALASLEQFVGYRPNALATMARRPGLLAAVLALVNAALRQDGHLPTDQRYVLACEAARHGGSRYTTTHLAHAAHCAGVHWQRIAMLASPAPGNAPTDAERALLALAGPLPDARHRDAAWQAAGGHWQADALTEAVGVIALTAWFTRWNTLVETEMEGEPAIALEHVPWLVGLTG